MVSLHDPRLSIETLEEFQEALHLASKAISVVPVYFFESEWDLLDDEEWLD